MSMSTLQVLKRARERLAEPRNWRKHAFRGRNADGEPTYCAMGALGYRTNTRVAKQAEAAAAVLKEFVPPKYITIADWNDHYATTHEQVLAAFDRAIEELS